MNIQLLAFDKYDAVEMFTKKTSSCVDCEQQSQNYSINRVIFVI